MKSGKASPMERSTVSFVQDRARFEVLPLGRSEQEAERLPHPVRLTVTCSPKHGPDEAVAVARRLHRIGHALTVHVAARMVRDRAHLDSLLAAMAQAGADDLFLIGGDADPPLGEYASAVELLPIVAEHPQRPRTIGIAGYPEGHPLISDDELARALAQKSAHADYVTTQMCFDPDVRARVGSPSQRRQGMTLPVLIGMPGQGRATPAARDVGADRRGSVARVRCASSAACAACSRVAPRPTGCTRPWPRRSMTPRSTSPAFTTSRSTS